MASEEPAVKKARVAAEGGLQEIGEAIITEGLQYAMARGLIMAAKPEDRKRDPTLVTHCPVALLPLKVPAKAFHEAVDLAPLWNRLVDACARDVEWLHCTLAHTARADDFVERLMGICRRVHARPGGVRQKLYLGIHRSDYMLHEPAGCSAEDARFLQVELNTIASSFGALSSRAADLHRFLLERFSSSGEPLAGKLQSHFASVAPRDSDLASHLPQNDTLEQLPAALAAAHGAYGVPGSVVVFVVQVGERNFADQRWLEYALWDKHKVPVIRKSLGELHQECTLDDASGKLTLATGQEISVAYFRAGYVPGDYLSEKEWKAREMLEESLAIKCPSVAYQLVGTKKVQQAIAPAGACERFLPTADAARLRQCFAGLWGLGPGEDDAEIVQKAMTAPHGFVMKPQREGGGNNFYGADVAEKLRELSTDDRGAYILMQRIEPRAQMAAMARAGDLLVTPAMSEFGFYSVFLGAGGDAAPVVNRHAGHLVRSKAEGVDEGGVASGYAVVSSPFLVG